MSRARWEVVREVRVRRGHSPESHTVLTIRDVGSWDRVPTITNDAEAVIEDLVAAGKIRPDGDQVLYYDSEGDLGELLVRNGKFAGFAPGPRL